MATRKWLDEAATIDPKLYMAVDWARQGSDVTMARFQDRYMQIIPERPELPDCVIANEGELEQPIITQTVDVYAILDFIHREINRLVDMGYEPDMVVFGAEEFATLTRSPYSHNLYEFKIELDYRTRRGRGTVMGLPIRVSPTLRGWAVIPKER